MPGEEKGKDKVKDVLPTLEDLLERRDYTGAITLLKFRQNTKKADTDSALWLAYAAFHNGDYQTARKVRINYLLIYHVLC